VLGNGVSDATCDEVISQLSPYTQEMNNAAVSRFKYSLILLTLD